MRHGLLLFAVLALTGQCPGAVAATEAEQARRREAFREFATPFVGTWECEIHEWSATSSEPVWSDRQRRIFTLTMSRQFLEERAILKTPEGREYEAGLHLTTFDPNSDAIVQHGFWLPLQPDPLFRIEGRIEKKDFRGSMRIREQDGSHDTRPLAIKWIGPDEWHIEVTDQKADGSTFVRERVVYRRATKQE
jgi:hypothetical protein